jgi:hypothetical protein
MAMREVPRALAGPAAGLLGAVALLVVGLALRPVLRVPSLPEVLSEWATFYVPQALFAYMINTFREQAKVMLLWNLVGLVLLVGALAGAVYARWPGPRTAIGLGLGLWLFTLLVILPGSGLGFFGMDAYPAGPLEVSAAYLAGWGAFALVLALVYWLLVPSSRQRRPATPPASGASLGTPTAP